MGLHHRVMRFRNTVLIALAVIYVYPKKPSRVAITKVSTLVMKGLFTDKGVQILNQSIASWKSTFSFFTTSYQLIILVDK